MVLKSEPNEVSLLKLRFLQTCFLYHILYNIKIKKQEIEQTKMCSSIWKNKEITRFPASAGFPNL